MIAFAVGFAVGFAAGWIWATLRQWADRPGDQDATEP